ncbi:hypothetical protein [Pseudokineococcus sp. 1T1Z-3]|uniref:hypothetical protein n=1 Tax=Pseudokineococcus sp. 1T1Z-3 TaxID=3132745 RepID=UPI0030A1069D
MSFAVEEHSMVACDAGEYRARVRWERLFADLEAQLEAEAEAALRSEVADRTRAEQADVWLADRVRAHVGAPLVLHLQGGGVVVGRVEDVGPDWVVLLEQAAAGRSQALVPLGVVSSVGGLTRRVALPAGQVLRRLSLRTALRALARDRAPVRLDVAGASYGAGAAGPASGELAGTLDRVAADHVDLALHPPGEPRRAGAVLEVRAVPLAALRVVRSS